jgi:hypothetical protein
MTCTDTQHSSTSPAYRENGTTEYGRIVHSNKEKIKQPIDVEVEEVVQNFAPMPPAIFHRDYLPPRKDDTPPVIYQ